MAGYHHPPTGMPSYGNPNGGRLEGLNGLPSDYELALQSQQRSNGFDNHGVYDFQADLDMFTNTQFFDFEMAEIPDTHSPHNGRDETWNMNAGFATGHPPSSDFRGFNAGPQQHQYPIYPTATASTTPSTITSPTVRDDSANKTRQNSAAIDPSAHLEEAGREANEEDKRRRNTAASARFRVKKKQREQALEKSAKDMTERVSYLEQRVQNLEMENKLLKDLITEKSGVAPNVGELAVEEKLEELKSHKPTPAKRKEVKIETKAAS